MLTPKSELANRIQFTNNLKMTTNRSNLIRYKIMMLVKRGMENIFLGEFGNFSMGVSPLLSCDCRSIEITRQQFSLKWSIFLQTGVYTTLLLRFLIRL